MAKKILLHTRSEPAFYTLIGISCQLMDYRLIHSLNKAIGANFSKEDDFRSIASANQSSAAFSLYSWKDEDRRNSYYLVANTSQEIVLVPELKHTDFLMLVEGEFKKTVKETLLKTIRSIPRVVTAFEIKINDIKNPEAFLTDLEIHFTNIRKELKQKNKFNH